MTCRQCIGIEKVFDAKSAARELRKYRRRGPSKTTKILIDAIVSQGVSAKKLLDIGGGVGAVQHELIRAGVESAIGVDASPAYLQAAKEESARQGHQGRVRQHGGDFVEIGPTLDPVDIVTLDRVICCYPDVEALVGQSSKLAKEIYGLVYPRDNWFFRSGARVVNLFLWIARCPFRAFIHPSARVESLVVGSGFQKRFYRKTLLWQIVVYVKGNRSRSASGLNPSAA